MLSCVFAPAQAQERHALPPFAVQAAKKRVMAPAFALRDLSGKERSLAEFSGKIVLIHFWASWCDPCKQEFPALSALAAEFGPRGLVVLGVAGDSLERVEAFLEDNRAGFPVLIDQYGSVMRAYRVGVIPFSVIVGKDGRVAGTLVGPHEYGSEEARGYFEKMLE